MEKWELFDKNERSLNIIQDSSVGLTEKEYHLYVDIWVMNTNGEVLITLRSKTKKPSPNLWENTGGAVWAGENVIQAAKRELYEETGLKVEEYELIELSSSVYDNTISHIFLVRMFETPSIILNPDETIDYKWVSLDTIHELLENRKMVPSIKQKFFCVREELVRYAKMSAQKLPKGPYLRIVCNYSSDCNFKCKWCHSEGVIQKTQRQLLSPEEIAHVVTLFYEEGIKKIKLIGGEATLRRDLPKIIYNIRSIAKDIDISLVTNGSMLAEKIDEYCLAGLSRVNITLTTLNKNYFLHNVGNIEQYYSVLRGIDRAVKINMCSKINHIYHDTEDLLNILEFARERNVRINLLNKIPSPSSLDYTSVSGIIKVVETLPISKKYVEYDPYSLPVLIYKLDNGVEIEIKNFEIGKQKLLRSCESCKKKKICKEGIYAFRLTPNGSLQPCLIRDDNILPNAIQVSKEVFHDYMKRI